MSDTESITVTASWNDTDNQSAKWTFSEENGNHTTTTSDDNNAVDKSNDPTGNSSVTNVIENGNIITNDTIENSHIVTGDNNVSFVNINYTIQPKPFLSHFKTIPTKKILNNVSGSMNPGLNAILGPSGSGKTSLLDVLADRKAKKGLSGHVLINGKRQSHNFKCASAYVVQDDLLLGTLSVRENLAFSAALRLPMTLRRKERSDKVESVISELGLSHVANTKVGTELIRGISGGQKKRTSIGMELIISPGIIFLDEPTTGLDAGTAVSVVRLLKELSLSGRVIIMSIHQPRYSIYKLFDLLTLMSRGRLVYHGPSNNALNYFSEIGYQCEQHNNPADFFLDVIIENEEAEGPSAEISEIESSNRVRLAEIFEKSKEFQTVKQHLDGKLKTALSVPQGETPEFATSFPWQFGVLAVRTIRNLLRNRLATGVQVVMMVGIAVVLGLVFLQADDDFVGVQDRIGAIFFAIINAAFINIHAVEVFQKEKPIFVHQNVSGYYRVSSYFLAKVSCDLIPIRIIPIIIYVIIFYWMLGLESDAGKFFFFMLTLVLMASCASAIAFAISSAAPVAGIAIAGTASALILQVMFSGFLKNLRTIDDWIAWLQYLSVIRYALNAVVVNELDGNEYPPGCGSDNSTSTFDCLVGRDYLDTLGYLEFDIWYNILALACFNVGYLFLSYLILRIIKKEK
ncbi:broad substrate specificity ATP-binding cassette transporter ABCG2-like [Dysidea avara]|uniref:broad substrate specificity ATP-binding cassette transporter ABCG2-like n=1 Tax=Dysidea avara TaxID=196820 RepID=UPI0033200D63